MKQLALTLIFGIALGSALYGQVAPPTFLCVNNDTLVWETPVNNCGPFNAYLIFASQDIGGPYSQLASVTNPAQTEFVHENAGMGTWFYYLESDFDCPGEPVLQSDTLDNRIPEGAQLQAVSVNGSDVEVSWIPSPSPEVVAYLISRNVPGQGTTLLDTVFSGNTYLDTEAAPNEGSETYFIEAIDQCGNKSLVGDPHNTIFLTSQESSPCERSLTLNWNLYQNWPGGIDAHEIWVSRNNEAPKLEAATFGDVNSYTFENADDGVEYCFTVRAQQAGKEVEAASNEVCLTLDVVQAVRQLVAVNATVTENNEVSLSWVWNPNAEIARYSILQSRDNVDFTAIESLSPEEPLQMQNSFLASGAEPDRGARFFQLQTIDDCEEQVTSNTVGTIYLRANARSGANALNWTPYVNENGTVISYKLYRLGGGNPVLLNSLGPNTRETVDDNINLADSNQVRACYYIEAEVAVSLSDTSEVVVTSRSNIACAEQEASIYIPNAFSPNGDGRNDVFLPFLQFGAPTAYTLAIYDRWGGKIFETNTFGKGWEGNSSEGERVPVGLYLYHLRIEQGNGKVLEETGEISLMR